MQSNDSELVEKHPGGISECSRLLAVRSVHEYGRLQLIGS
jgi:hypothetical protein